MTRSDPRPSGPAVAGTGERRRGLTVAVTGATGDIGRSLLRALDASREIEAITAMARRPFDPRAAGLHKTTYRQADVLDRDAVAGVVAGADVVVHLAFLIMGNLKQTTAVNLEGSRNVFAAAISAGARRLVYASSVAAYGFGADNPELLTEDVAARGTEHHYYSAQKSQLEATLWELLRGTDTAAYVLRPCIVAGPDALALVRVIPYVQLSEAMPTPCCGARSGWCRSSSRSCPTRASRFSWYTTMMSPRRCAPRCSGAASPGSTISPARAR